MLGIFFKKIDLADKETHIFHFFLSLTTFLYLISSFITVLHNGQRSPNHYYLWVNIFFSSSKMKGREFMSWEFYPYNLWQLSVKLESFFQELTFLAVKKKKFRVGFLSRPLRAYTLVVLVGCYFQCYHSFQKVDTHRKSFQGFKYRLHTVRTLFFIL